MADGDFDFGLAGREASIADCRLASRLLGLGLHGRLTVTHGYYVSSVRAAWERIRGGKGAEF
jgi:hypothetical protein